MKFKEGDTVKVVRANTGFDQIHVGRSGKIIDVDDNCSCPYRISGIPSIWGDDELELIKEKDMYKQGDVLANDAWDVDFIVQGMIGDIVLSTDSDDGGARINSLLQLENTGWKLKTETPTTELTIDQIAEKFDLKPEQVRIKKADV